MLRNIFTSLLAASAITAAAANTVDSDFSARKAAVGNQSYFNAFNAGNIPADAEEYMKFLYAYMPLPDLIDYSSDFYLANVEASLKARDEMPWGKSVPEREFRHFVLPVRINNENLDMSRPYLYNELKSRVEGLSMADAILEVNHWCHEKATYQPSDGRTSSPLSTISQAIGRCGEESTFAVAALRAVGIPARQVYTPRWAHTDDNHAWVEAWADGRWHFLGACEPEAVLDLGWFNAPASRGIMMNTKAFGRYDGPEEVLESNPVYTAINVTENYAPVATLKVKVTDTDGRAVGGADVRFSVYNYAEYYPIGIKTTDASGEAQLTSGLGDLIIHASKDSAFGLAKASVGKDGIVTVVLDMKPGDSREYVWNLMPPAQSASFPYVSPEMAALNDRRKAAEDSIRGAYTATFHTPESAREFAVANGYDPARTEKILIESRGNHRVIENFLASAVNNREKALTLLSVISEKDRRDITPEVLADHFATPEGDSPLYDMYVLNPRIANEGLTPYKSALAATFDAETLRAFHSAPAKLVKWVADSISINTSLNPQNLVAYPEAVRKINLTDTGSRNNFFVALARTAGIPARIDPVTGKVQYSAGDGVWTDVNFDKPVEVKSAPQGTLNITYTPVGHITDPTYYTHFSISRIDAGKPVLQEYQEMERMSVLFGKPVKVDAGQYMLTSGQRMADGTVLARTVVYNVNPDDTTDLELVMRQDTTGVQVIGNFNSENLYKDMQGVERSILSTSGRGYFVIGMVKPAHEPSSHALNDLAAAREQLEKTGLKIFLIFPDDEAASRFDPSAYGKLPSNVVFGIDSTGAIAADMPSADLPVFIIGDTFNRVVFESSGYNINLGERLYKTIHKL